MTEENNDLPQLPRGWSMIKVGEAIKNIPLTGRKLKQRQYAENGVLPVIDQGQKFIGGFTDREDLKTSVKAPVIVFGDHTKVVKFVDFDFVAGADGVKVLEPLGFFFPKLFYYFLHALELPEKGYARHFQFLEKSFIRIPPLNEQRRIVSRVEELFSCLDTGVESLLKVKTLLKRYRQAVLKYAFEGKLTDEWRKTHKDQTEPAQKLLEHIKQERRKTGTENESLTSLRVRDLPQLPENWVWTTFGQLLESSQNGVSKRRGVEGKPVHVLRLSDIAEGKIVSASPRDIKLTDSEIEKFLLKMGDLLCIRVNGSRNLTGRLIAFDKKESWAFCDHFIRFRLIKGFVSGYYVSSFFNTEHARSYIESNMVSSAGQNTVSQTTLAGVPVPLAPIEEQLRMVGEIEHHSSLADETEEKVEFSLTESERLRHSILKTAFEGKLVPQDPSDEPAEKLLERIKKEKEKHETHTENRKGSEDMELMRYVE